MTNEKIATTEDLLKIWADLTPENRARIYEQAVFMSWDSPGVSCRPLESPCEESEEPFEVFVIGCWRFGTFPDSKTFKLLNVIPLDQVDKSFCRETTPETWATSFKILLLGYTGQSIADEAMSQSAAGWANRYSEDREPF